MTPLRSYFICTSPRSGSTLLEYSLSKTGLAGCAKEYYDLRHEPEWIERLKLTPENYFEKIFEAGTTPNGIFGAKLFWFQTLNLAKRLGKPTIFTVDKTESLETYFPGLRYIWLIRRDKIRQAVSWYKTGVTDVWRMPVGKKEQPQDKEMIRASFNFKEIDHYFEELMQADEFWRTYFERRSITPLKIAYEDLVASFEATVLKVLQLLEIPLPPDFKVPPPQLQKQSDDISEEWVARYIDIKSHRQHILPTAAS